MNAIVRASRDFRAEEVRHQLGQGACADGRAGLAVGVEKGKCSVQIATPGAKHFRQFVRYSCFW